MHIFLIHKNLYIVHLMITHNYFDMFYIYSSSNKFYNLPNTTHKFPYQEYIHYFIHKTSNIHPNHKISNLLDSMYHLSLHIPNYIHYQDTYQNFNNNHSLKYIIRRILQNLDNNLFDIDFNICCLVINRNRPDIVDTLFSFNIFYNSMNMICMKIHLEWIRSFICRRWIRRLCCILLCPQYNSNHLCQYSLLCNHF